LANQNLECILLDIKNVISEAIQTALDTIPDWYDVRRIELGTARDGEEIRGLTGTGNRVIPVYLDGEAYLSFDNPVAPKFDLRWFLYRGIKYRYQRLYLTNPAQANKLLQLLIGHGDFEVPGALYGMYQNALKPVAVDEGGNISAIMKGLYDSTLKGLAVDELGRIMAMIKAYYGTTVKNVQTDEFGNLKLNLVAQELAQAIVWPTHNAVFMAYGTAECPAGVETILCSVSGKGHIFGGYVYTIGEEDSRWDAVHLRLDGSVLNSATYYYLDYLNLDDPNINFLNIRMYERYKGEYCAGIAGGSDFNSEFKLGYVAHSGGPPTVEVRWVITYALV